MRKTIYVPSQEVWDEVLVKAKAMGLSVSQYLLRADTVIDTHEKEYGKSVIKVLSEINAKLDQLLLDRGSPSQEELYNKAKYPNAKPQGIEISDAENRLLNDEYVKEFLRDKQAEKSKEVIKTVDDIPKTFRSYSKAEQVGKKK